MSIKLYLANLAAYGEGDLKGEWINLPEDFGKLDSILKEICPNGEEYAIHDYELPKGVDFRIGEHDRVEDINEVAEFLESAGDDAAFKAVLSVQDNFEEAKSTYQNGEYTFYEGCKTAADIGRYALQNGLIDEQTIFNAGYKDFESFGHDEAINWGDPDESIYAVYGVDEDDDEALGEAIYNENQASMNVEYYADDEAYFQSEINGGHISITSFGAINLFS